MPPGMPRQPNQPLLGRTICNGHEKNRAAAGELKVANRILDLLSTDDGFRELFVKDARAAFAMAGYVHADDITAHPAHCWTVECLASKESIARDRVKLVKSLNNIQGFLAPKEMRGQG